EATMLELDRIHKPRKPTDVRDKKQAPVFHGFGPHVRHTSSRSLVQRVSLVNAGLSGEAYASMRFASSHDMGSTMVGRGTAPQPLLTRDKQREMAQCHCNGAPPLGTRDLTRRARQRPVPRPSSQAVRGCRR